MRRAISARDQLRALFDAAVAAADPYTPTRDALLERLAQRNREGRGWIVAVGKASAGMAEAALAAAEQTGVPIAGGVVVGPDGANLAPPLEALIGDHPIPGARSFHAAMRIGSLANAVHQNEEVIVLISGGTSSLIAAPADDLPARAVSELFRSLLAAGGATDIHVMNAIRKRFLRWGGGRLAAAFAPAWIHQVILSDVVGDDPAVIASGPAVPDPLSARDVLALIEGHGLVARIDPALIDHLHEVIAGRAAETPKSGDPVFERVAPPLIMGRTQMHEGIARAASLQGVALHVHDAPITGDARAIGGALARWLLEREPGIYAGSGETTVQLGDRHGRGGRCQEFALAAALALDGTGERVTLLAAGTDGRDGPTDAAGAMVDGTTAARIRAAGLDPRHELTQHNAYVALNAADALLRTGHTGTNVADAVLAVVQAA
jgi:glycerate 2-kinase